jgi:hypothetical protein
MPNENPKTKTLDSLDPMAIERAKRAAKYIKTGAGLNQGDQAEEVAEGLEEAAKQKKGGRWRYNEEEQEILKTAQKLKDLRK